MKKVFLTTLLLTTIYLLLTTPANAQSFLGGVSSINRLASELVVNVSPSYPKPLQTVYINLEMYTENLDSSDISYYVNGALIKKGKGLREFSFLTGPAGRTTNVDIAVTLQNGTSFTRNLSLTGASVDILVQSDSYTPPFYKGRSLYAPQSRVRLVAVPYLGPSTSSVNHGSNLIYKWSIDGEVEQSISGYGKNAVNVQGDLLGTPTLVEVLVTDPTTGTTASGLINLTPNDPIILFYENHPLYGIVYERAITGNTEMLGEEMNVVANTFNMSKVGLYTNNYKWKINGQSAEDIKGRSALFRKPESVAGESLVSVEVDNPIRYLQYGKSSFMIKFDKNNEITN